MFCIRGYHRYDATAQTRTRGRAKAITFAAPLARPVKRTDRARVSRPVRAHTRAHHGVLLEPARLAVRSAECPTQNGKPATSAYGAGITLDAARGLERAVSTRSERSRARRAARPEASSLARRLRPVRAPDRPRTRARTALKITCCRNAGGLRERTCERRRRAIRGQVHD